MNKVELQSVCTAPPREWLAIHKKNGKPVRVQAIDLDRSKVLSCENFERC